MPRNTMPGYWQHECFRVHFCHPTPVCSRTSREIREVIFDLRSENVEEGIGLQISRMLAEWSKTTGISGEYNLSGLDIALPPETVRQLRNIMSEALTNIRRHAGASHVQVNVDTSHEALNIEINDNGRGIGRSADNLHSFVSEGKLGIAGMKERAEFLGGSFALSSDQTGTSVKFSVPIKQESNN